MVIPPPKYLHEKGEDEVEKEKGTVVRVHHVNPPPHYAGPHSSLREKSSKQIYVPKRLFRLKNGSHLQGLTWDWFPFDDGSLGRRTGTVELRHWVHLTWTWSNSRALHLSGRIAASATLILSLNHGSWLTLLHGSSWGSRAWVLTVWSRWADLKSIWCHSLTVHAR